MCQLFGLNSAKPVTPHFSLRGFFRRGGGTDHHGDGWGLAYYDNDNDKAQSYLRVRDTAAHQCLDAQAILDNPFRSANVIAHVRKATVGAVSDRNSHPFVRTLWGKDWVFAHNGDLKDFNPVLGGGYLPLGETDSEKAFCHLLTRLVEHFGSVQPDTGILLEYIAKLSTTIAGHGNFNFLLNDGHMLIAHCSTDLYWTQRSSPFGRVELLDDDHVIDFVHHNDTEDRVVIVATSPLTRGEAWYPMGQGEIRAFANGIEIVSAVTGRPVSVSQQPLSNAVKKPVWSTGWNLGEVALA